MLRKITKDIGRFEAGNMHDYGRGIWNDIAKSLMSQQAARAEFEAQLAKELKRELTDADRDDAEPRFNAFLDAFRARQGAKASTDRQIQAFLATFSEPFEFNPAEQSMTRGNVKVRNRLGSETRQATRG